MNIETQDRQNKDSGFTNFIEIRVYGLMRSGNHAIIKWIQDQYPGQITCFLNNVKHGNCDPYTSTSRKIFTGIDEHKDIETLRKMKKHVLIYSYEDRAHLESQGLNFLSSVFQSDFENNRKRYLGKSQHQFDVAIIRDPFNCFASRLALLQKKGPLGGVSDMELVAHNWKILAKEVISLNKYPKPRKIAINYNWWVVDQNYRKNLSLVLMGVHNDLSLEQVSRFGGGSSFQETNYKLTIRKLMQKWYKVFDARRFAKISLYWKGFTTPKLKKAVFERWRIFSKNEIYRRLFVDKELIELSEELFGEIPGTREFLKSINQ